MEDDDDRWEDKVDYMVAGGKYMVYGGKYMGVGGKCMVYGGLSI